MTIIYDYNIILKCIKKKDIWKRYVGVSSFFVVVYYLLMVLTLAIIGIRLLLWGTNWWGAHDCVHSLNPASQKWLRHSTRNVNSLFNCSIVLMFHLLTKIYFVSFQRGYLFYFVDWLSIYMLHFIYRFIEFYSFVYENIYNISCVISAIFPP